MKNLKYKVLMAYFEPVYVEHPKDKLELNSYTVFQYENGLIQVESYTTNDWFFDCADNIEGCGNDHYLRCEDTGETGEISALDLVQSFGGSVAEFGDLSCTDLVKELAHY